MKLASSVENILIAIESVPVIPESVLPNDFVSEEI